MALARLPAIASGMGTPGSAIRRAEMAASGVHAAAYSSQNRERPGSAAATVESGKENMSNPPIPGLDLERGRVGLSGIGGAPLLLAKLTEPDVGIGVSPGRQRRRGCIGGKERDRLR